MQGGWFKEQREPLAKLRQTPNDSPDAIFTRNYCTVTQLLRLLIEGRIFNLSYTDHCLVRCQTGSFRGNNGFQCVRQRLFC